MYHHFQGKIVEKQPSLLVIDVAGVGYQLGITQSSYQDLPAVGKEALVYAYQAVRENDITLFGFATKEERSLFLNLIKVSGVGPSIAQQILGQLPIQSLVQAIVKGEVTSLQRLKGLGKKTAERIVVELKDRLKGVDLPGETKEVGAAYPQDAYRALLVLGLSADEARKRLNKLAENDAMKEVQADTWIKMALKNG